MVIDCIASLRCNPKHCLMRDGVNELALGLRLLQYLDASAVGQSDEIARFLTYRVSDASRPRMEQSMRAMYDQPNPLLLDALVKTAIHWIVMILRSKTYKPDFCFQDGFTVQVHSLRQKITCSTLYLDPNMTLHKNLSQRNSLSKTKK